MTGEASCSKPVAVDWAPCLRFFFINLGLMARRKRPRPSLQPLPVLSSFRWRNLSSASCAAYAGGGGGSEERNRERGNAGGGEAPQLRDLVLVICTSSSWVLGGAPATEHEGGRSPARCAQMCMIAHETYE